uniref:Putative secreted protein n=1 Tax=Ixodes ricinus TaxID=34613 RepID=A0A6B0UWB1_IXORI
MRCLLTHLVNVFFWMASRSSAMRRTARSAGSSWRMLSGCSRTHSVRLGPRSMDPGGACDPNEPYQAPVPSTARSAAESTDGRRRRTPPPLHSDAAARSTDTRQSVQLLDRGLASFRPHITTRVVKAHFRFRGNGCHLRESAAHGTESTRTNTHSR